LGDCQSLICYELSFQRLTKGPNIHGWLLPWNEEKRIRRTLNLISVQSHDGPFKERLQSESEGDIAGELGILRRFPEMFYAYLGGKLPKIGG
jgi:hypothetical protein